MDLAFDGKEANPKGPTVPVGLTFSAKKRGDRSFEFIEKMEGKPIYTTTFKMSDDGRTMTEAGKPTGSDEPFIAVYERQS